jgi:hypothetical protein
VHLPQQERSNSTTMTDLSIDREVDNACAGFDLNSDRFVLRLLSVTKATLVNIEHQITRD